MGFSATLQPLLHYVPMPVTKSAKAAQAVSERRHAENLVRKDKFKQAVKAVRKAVTSGSEELAKLFGVAQSTLDRAAKSKTIHPNKAARLKSRMAKKMATAVPVAELPAKKAARKPAAKKKVT